MVRDDFGNVLETEVRGGHENSRTQAVFEGNQGRIKTESKMKLNNGGFQQMEKIIQYDRFGNPEIARNMQGVKTYNKYDEMGRLHYSISDTGAWKKISYNNGPGLTALQIRHITVIKPVMIQCHKWLYHPMFGLVMMCYKETLEP